MIIKEHGINIKEHGMVVTLVGMCESCWCQFETFSEILHKGKRNNKVAFLFDKDCEGMRMSVETVSSSSDAVIGSIDYSCKCPECGGRVNLKIKGV